MKTMTKLQRLLSHLKQPSTIRGLVTLAGVFGVVFEPNKVEEIAIAVGTIVGLYEAIRDGEKK